MTVVVENHPRGPKIASALKATRFLMDKLGITAEEALSRLGVAKLGNMPKKFRKRLHQIPDSEIKGCEFGTAVIKAPSKINFEGELSKLDIALLCKFVSSGQDFEARYAYKSDIGEVRGYASGSGHIAVKDLTYLLIERKALSPKVQIPLEKIISLDLRVSQKQNLLIV